MSNGQLDQRIGLTAALLCRLSDNKKEADQVIQPSLRRKKRITLRLKCVERQAHGGEGVKGWRGGGENERCHRFDKQGCRRRGYQGNRHLNLAGWLSKGKSHSGLCAES